MHLTGHKLDQATRLRELVAGASSQVQAAAMTVAIVSGKGGVGKTNLAVNLAINLAGRGLRVTLLDADLGLANADLLLNVSAQHNLSHVISGQRSIEEVGVRLPGGVFFVPGASGLEQLANLSEFERQSVIAQLNGLGNDADVILLDCGAGISRNVLAFAAAADICLVVTTPEPTSITDAYAVIKTMINQKKHENSIHLVVNRAESRREARDVFQRLSGVAQRFLNYSIADGGYLLQDVHVEMAVRERRAFVSRFPRCSASGCVAAIAARLADRRTVVRQTGGFFRRVVGLFV